MSNYNFNVTLDGLNNVNANDINTDNIVTDYLTVVKNSSVPLVTPYTSNTNQIASCAFVQDAFLNNLLNYALLNPLTPQTFTGTNIFGILQANTPSTNANSVRVATTAYVKNNLLNYVTLNTTQTITAEKTFTANEIHNGVITNNSTTNFVYPGVLQILDPTATKRIQIFNASGNFTTLQAIGINSKFQIRTSNATTQQSNLIIQNSNQVTIQGTANQGIEILNDQITMNGNLTLNKPFISNYIDLSSSIF